MKSFKPPATIAYEDWLAIIVLLKADIPLGECLELLKNKRNAKVFEALKAELQKGEDPKTVVGCYLPVAFKGSFTSFGKILSFNAALELTIAVYDQERDKLKALRKDLLYPVLLLFGTLGGLYLFDNFGLDAIFNTLRSFELDLGTFAFLRAFFRLIIYAVYGIFLIGALAFLIFKSPKRIVFFYLFVSKFMPESLFIAYYSQSFMSLYELCYRMGYKTKETLSLLKSLKDKPVIAFLAYHVDEALRKGASFNEAVSNPYLDRHLRTYIKIAIYSHDFEKIVSRYVALTQAELQRKIKNYAKFLQCGIYFMVGILIIFIYQVLFLPMQAIGQF